MRDTRRVILALVFSGVPDTAHGQQIDLKGPLACAPPAIYVRPPALEWTYWLAAGIAAERSTRDHPVLGAGAEATVWLARGLPGDPLELRGGLWVEVTTTFDPGDAVTEGGLELTLGHERGWKLDRGWSFGAFGLRVGGGGRALDGARAADLVETLTWGVHAFMEPRWLVCPYDDEPRPRSFGSVARVFATHRSEGNLRPSAWTFGIELTARILDAASWGR